MNVRSQITHGVSVVLITLLAGCSTPTTKQVDLAPDLVALEEARQRQLAMETQHEHQARISNLAYPLLTGAVSLCQEDTARLFGMTVRSAHSWDDEAWRNAARGALGLGDSIEVVAVAGGSPADEAGVQVGDVLTQFGEHTVGAGKDGLEEFYEYIGDLKLQGPTEVSIGVRRDDQVQDIDLSGIRKGCSYTPRVVVDNRINAFADGSNIVVTTGMMRFAEDDELTVILGHELAHNAMGHIDAKKKNALLGGVLGALADIASAAAGVPTGGAYTQEGLQAGAQAYSQDFEREADYVGMYAMALAGYDYSNAAQFWRQMGGVNPGAIAFASTHPSTAERFIRLEYTEQELDRKRTEGLALVPDSEEDADGQTYRGPDGASLTFTEGDYQHSNKSLDQFENDRKTCRNRLLERATAGKAGKSALTPSALHSCLTEDMGWQPNTSGNP